LEPAADAQRSICRAARLCLDAKLGTNAVWRILHRNGKTNHKTKQTKISVRAATKARF
jgi:hypothetical protein